MLPGHVERIEFEYIRHGTLSLIANFDIATGQVICPSIGPTRTARQGSSSSSHRIRFVYTPRHASWLNQVELWFSILARRLLKRSSFTSVDDLRSRALQFIGYFNKVLAKAFRWTFTGRPLQA